MRRLPHKQPFPRSRLGKPKRLNRAAAARERIQAALFCNDRGQSHSNAWYLQDEDGRQTRAIAIAAGPKVCCS